VAVTIVVSRGAPFRHSAKAVQSSQPRLLCLQHQARVSPDRLPRSPVQSCSRDLSSARVADEAAASAQPRDACSQHHSRRLADQASTLPPQWYGAFVASLSISAWETQWAPTSGQASHWGQSFTTSARARGQASASVGNLKSAAQRTRAPQVVSKPSALQCTVSQAATAEAEAVVLVAAVDVDAAATVVGAGVVVVAESTTLAVEEAAAALWLGRVVVVAIGAVDVVSAVSQPRSACWQHHACLIGLQFTRATARPALQSKSPAFTF